MSYTDNYGELDGDDLGAEPVFPYDQRKADQSGWDGTNDGKFDEEAGIPWRLKRLIRVYDVLKDHDMSALCWDRVGYDLETVETGSRSLPPPSDDPRTQLPEIFGFRGYNRYKSPDFYVRDYHPPCYPQELVGRLKALHESGEGSKRKEDLSYIVYKKYEDYEGSYRSDDDDDSGDNSEYIECIGTFETLELANDAVMAALERGYREHLMFQESKDDGGTPDFNCGLHFIVPEGEEAKLRYDGEEGVTWHLDKLGCLRLTGHGQETITVFTQAVRRGAKVVGCPTEDVQAAKDASSPKRETTAGPPKEQEAETLEAEHAPQQPKRTAAGMEEHLSKRSRHR